MKLISKLTISNNIPDHTQSCEKQETTIEQVKRWQYVLKMCQDSKQCEILHWKILQSLIRASIARSRSVELMLNWLIEYVHMYPAYI